MGSATDCNGRCGTPFPQLDKLGDRCFTLRHAGDAERLRDNLLPGKSIVIVGAGTIGLELAASATQRGCQVTVVELAPTVMGRNAPAPVRDYLLARHQLAGVRVLLNSAIEHAEAGECLAHAAKRRNSHRRCGDLWYRYRGERYAGPRSGLEQ